MGKIFNEVSKDLLAAMKAKESDKANALRNLKKKLLDYKTSPEGAKIVNANNGEIPDAQEINIVKKYVKELDGDIALYKESRPNLAESSEKEKSYLVGYVPQETSAEDIEKAVNQYITDNGLYTMKEMGNVMGFLKRTFKNVDGKLASDIVKSHITK